MNAAPLATASAPRPGSVAERADQRHLFALYAIAGFPIAALSTLGVPPVAIVVAGAGAAIIGSTFAWDVALLVRLLLDARRARRTLPPTRRGVDYGVGRDAFARTIPANDPYRSHDRTETLARGCPRAAARYVAARVLVRVAALSAWGGLACCGVLVAPVHHHGCEIGSTRTALNTIRSATLFWMSEHPDGGCPTIAQLKADGTLGSDFTARDAWDGDYALTCTAGEITASSAGPDRRWGTNDDLVIPVPDPPDGAR
ncbi:MAG TPA: hypothetical protein VE987_13940 [Polyangiaceae bacterium]|nr:hypothetical protein [Polyangiaceae bacterium]